MQAHNAADVFEAFMSDPTFDAPPSSGGGLKCDPPSPSMEGRFTDAVSALRFMLAGNATITLRSKKTGTRYTYKLNRPKDDENAPPAWAANEMVFVSLLTGSDNENDFKYFGQLKRGVFYHGRKAKISAEAESVIAFDWAYRNLVKGRLSDQLEIWHEGSCGRCGRKLTVPESVRSGFGPECITKV